MAQQISMKVAPVKPARSLARAITALLLAIAAVLPAPARSAPTSLYTLPYTFTNDQGKVLRLSEWRGKPIILTMEYSSCRFMCTTTFAQLKELQAAADAKKLRIDFVIVSLDPENDTPEAWRQYRISRDVNRSNWHLLTGSEAATKEFAALVGIKYWYYGEHLLHDFKVLRLNAGGEIEKEITAYGVEPEYLLQ